MDGGFPFTCFDLFPQTVIFSRERVPLLIFFSPAGANLSASWSQSTRKYKIQGTKRRDGGKEDGEMAKYVC